MAILAMATKCAMGNSMEVVGNEEGDGKSGKSNGDGDKEGNDNGGKDGNGNKEGKGQLQRRQG